MRKCLSRDLLLGAAMCVAVSVGAVSAVGQSAGQDMKHAGHETSNAAKDAGHGVKQGTTKAYHETAHGTKKAYHKTAHGTKKAYHATGRAVEHTGDKMAGRPPQ